MNNEMKKIVGTWMVKLGELSVGKCMIPGMFDPEIPQKLRQEKDAIKTSENTESF